MTPRLREPRPSIGGLFSTSTECSGSECRLRNDRQSYIAITQQLQRAQMDLRDPELTARLWHEVKERPMDLGRLVRPLYGCPAIDEIALRQSDEVYLDLVDPSDP